MHYLDWNFINASPKHNVISSAMQLVFEIATVPLFFMNCGPVVGLSVSPKYSQQGVFKKWPKNLDLLKAFMLTLIHLP